MTLHSGHPAAAQEAASRNCDLFNLAHAAGRAEAEGKLAVAVAALEAIVGHGRDPSSHAAGDALAAIKGTT